MSIFGGNEAKEAKNLTAAIDRETDAAVLAEQDIAETTETEQKATSVEVLADKAREEAAKTEVHELEQAGWRAGEVSAETRALGGAALEQAVIDSDNKIKAQVAIENGYVDTGREAGSNVIGGESKEQIDERTKADLEDARMESGVDLPPELKWQAEILAKTQGSLAKKTMAVVNHIMRQRVVKPADVERFAWQERMDMTESIGRTFTGRK